MLSMFYSIVECPRFKHVNAGVGMGGGVSAYILYLYEIGDLLAGPWGAATSGFLLLYFAPKSRPQLEIDKREKEKSCK